VRSAPVLAEQSLCIHLGPGAFRIDGPTPLPPREGAGGRSTPSSTNSRPASRSAAEFARLHLPPFCSPFAPQLLRRHLKACNLWPARALLLHAWSPAAARACVPLAGPRCRVLVEIEAADSVLASVLWPPSGRRADVASFICQTDFARRRVLQRGAPDDLCTVIRPASVHAGNANSRAAASRAALRERLRLSDDEFAILPLVPLTRRTGAFIAAWGTLLTEKIRPEVRLLLPAGDAEYRRIRSLIESCHHEHIVRLAPPDLARADLLAVADLATFLPAGDAPQAALADALALGCPVLAADVAPLREVLNPGPCARLCPPRSPAHAARGILAALEQPEDFRLRAAAAQARAAEFFSPARLLAQYADVYADTRSPV